LSGTADGGFPLEAASIPSPTEVGGSWAFGDVDGDGLDDAMLPGYGDTVSFFRNDSPT